ncbi:outer membrane beta-barrel protein [Ulvibacter litoralis]|uniref:Outer membrane protein beta-barrel domain-containing protein n=1 Tax=Ulvibacter litoralis TaxID=227084 RepID=A0A1G7D710_9FLAO|nr:outer membrane beta-barrel protein [Ulvibacter litoralis]GHC44795.1 hypothetical protein GCM10008083_04270 [Ulvibacter litoralis]SDE46726.1 Outer membrane protein beta-barrel domain-containing protein [Ulvibacter litoralis]
MKNKKHIDQLFKDRFENFEPTPSPHVWGNIEAQLTNEKKDRKVIPLWWKFAGVAALVALLFTIGNSVFTTSKVDTTIVTEEKTIPGTQEQDVLDTNTLQNTNDKGSNSSIASENDAVPLNGDDANEVENASNPKAETPSNTKEAVYKKSSQYNTTVASETNASEEKKNTTTKSSNKAFNTVYGIDPTKDVAVNTSEGKKNTTLVPASETGNETILNSEKNNSLINKELGISETISTEIAQNNSTEETKEAAAASEKKSILDEIKEQETLKEDAAVAESKTIDNRWDVAPNFAPVYYNTLSSGSSIDPSFADNSQSGDVNFSYGVQISYALSERLSIRSGVSNVDLSYATGGVELGTGPVAVALKSINYNGTGTVVTALDAGTIREANAALNGGFGEIMPKSTNGEAQIVQSLSYYEVPLELKYAVFTKKFGVNLIGGLSTLFLGNNEVSVTAADFNSSLGEANNLSSVSFSTNVGLGFDYKISKKFKFNVEPMFKYQLNPYTDASVDFKPYYLGVYTGFSYKF